MTTTAPPAQPRDLRKASVLPGARRIARRLTAPGPKRILAIDGGGTRGIVACMTAGWWRCGLRTTVTQA